MALQTLTLAATARYPRTEAVSSVDSSDGLVIEIPETVGEIHVWADHAITYAAGQSTLGGSVTGDFVPLPSASSAHAVPARIWIRSDGQPQRTDRVQVKAASTSAEVYVAAFPRATGI
jgi:hypothetical protein